MSSRSLEARGRLSVLVVALATALFFIPGVPAAAAATHEVACPGESLQAAIDAANPGDTIEVSGHCNEIVTIDRDLNLTGLGGGWLDGNGLGPVISIAAGVNAHISYLTIRDGAAVRGAGIHNAGYLDMMWVVVDSNGVDSSLVTSVDGAGIYNAPDGAVVGDSISLINNVATGYGGAMFNEGDAELTNSWVQDNRSTGDWELDSLGTGGIANTGSLAMSSTELSENLGEGAGALGNGDGATAEVAASYFHDNSDAFMGGAMANDGVLAVTDSIFDDNYAGYGGGAIFSTGDLSVVGSAFNDNESSDAGGLFGGGAIYNLGTATISESSFDRNIAEEDAGGAIYNEGTMTIAESTFDDNYSERTGGAIYNGRGLGSAHLTIENSQITGNTSEYSASLGSRGTLNASGVTIAASSGSGLFTSGETSIIDSEISASTRSGIHISDGHLAMENVVVVDNLGRGLLTEPHWLFDCCDEPRSPRIDIDGVVIADNGLGGILLDSQSQMTAVGLTAVNNRADFGSGGGVLVEGGSLTLSDSHFDHNSAGSGGAIAVSDGGNVTVTDTTLNDNNADWNGGAIQSVGSTVEIVRSILNANTASSGGAIASVGNSTTSLVDSAMSYNLATDFGGGAFNVSSHLVVDRSAVTQNQAGGSGGGIESRFGAAGMPWLEVTNSTIASNHADTGSGIANRNGTMWLQLVTVTDNVRGPALFESTFSRTAVLENSILAGNRAGDCESAAIRSAGANVLGPGCSFLSPSATDVLDVADPRLTSDHPSGVITKAVPDAGSPAIDRVPLANCRQTVDQVWSARPDGPACDSGAIEAQLEVGDETPPIVDADFAYGDTFPPGVVTFTGSASDNVGVEWIGVAIQRLDTKKWLQDDGVSWGNFNRFEADLTSPGGPATDWSFSIALPDNRYVFSALAKDAAGNEGRIVPWRLFIVEGDATAPTVDADFAHNAELPVGSVLTGTAADNVGVTWVGIAVQDLATKKWLQDDMVSWGNFNRMPATLSNPGAVATDWSLMVDLPVGHYVLSARAKDAAGNSGYIVPWRGFYIVE